MKTDTDGERVLKGMKGCGLGSPDRGKGQLACSCEHGNELSGSIKFTEFLDF